ncbi:unnamed protein product [Chrysoparadoxa australica]
MGNTLEGSLPNKATLSLLHTTIWHIQGANGARAVVCSRFHSGKGEKVLIVNGTRFRKVVDLLDTSAIPFEWGGSQCEVVMTSRHQPPSLTSFLSQCYPNHSLPKTLLSFILSSLTTYLVMVQSSYPPPDTSFPRFQFQVVNFPGLTHMLLHVDGVKVPDIMAGGAFNDASHTSIQVSIPSTSTSKDVDDIRAPSSGANSHSSRAAGTVCYVIEASFEGHSCQAPVFRRFSDFDKLHCLVWSAYRGHHLAANLPALPAKTLKRTCAVDFIEQRRRELELYLKRLVKIPHAFENPDVLDFLQLRQMCSYADL